MQEQALTPHSASPAALAELPEHSSGLCLKSSLRPEVKLLILSPPWFSSLEAQLVMPPFPVPRAPHSAPREAPCCQGLFVLCLHRGLWGTGPWASLDKLGFGSNKGSLSSQAITSIYFALW